MKKLLFSTFHRLVSKRSGQSLIEILVAVAVGALMVTAASTIIAPVLKINTQASRVQTSAALAKELLDNVRVWAEGDWHNVQNLATTSANVYFLNSSVSPFIVAAGTESVLSDGVTSGTVGYWKLDEAAGATTQDFSGSLNTGTLNNSPTITTSSGCVAGNCLYFSGLANNGAGAKVTIPNAINLPSSFTFSHWINTTSTSGQMYTIGNAGGGNGYRFGLSGGVIAFLIGDASTFTESSCASRAVNDGKWHMITGVFNRTTPYSFTCYLDGVIQSTVSLPSGYAGMSTSAPSFASPPCCSSLKGYMDDVRIYNRALSDAEVKNIYNVTVYARSFYVDDVQRDASGNIGSGANDPSTKKVTVAYNWPKGATSTISDYLTRYRNNIFWQTDWSGGPGQDGPATSTNSKFSTSTKIDYTTSTGSIYINL